MKGMLKFNFLFFIPLCVFFFGIVQADITIWQVGTRGTTGEFVPSERRIIDYQVPLDWESLINQYDSDWGGFPAVIYPYNEKESCQEHAFFGIQIQVDFLSLFLG